MMVLFDIFLFFRTMKIFW